jgi:hypothetical protein
MAQSNMSFSGLPLCDATFDKWQEANSNNLSEKGLKKFEQTINLSVSTGTSDKGPAIEGFIAGIRQSIREINDGKYPGAKIEDLKRMVKDLTDYDTSQTQAHLEALSLLNKEIEQVSAKVLQPEKLSVSSMKAPEKSLPDILREYQGPFSSDAAKVFRNFQEDPNVFVDPFTGKNIPKEEMQIPATIIGLIKEVEVYKEELGELDEKIKSLKERVPLDYRAILERLEELCSAIKEGKADAVENLQKFEKTATDKLAKVLHESRKVVLSNQLIALIPDLAVQKGPLLELISNALDHIDTLTALPTIETYNSEAEKWGLPLCRNQGQFQEMVVNLLSDIEHGVLHDDALSQRVQDLKERLVGLSIQPGPVSSALPAAPSFAEEKEVIRPEVPLSEEAAHFAREAAKLKDTFEAMAEEAPSREGKERLWATMQRFVSLKNHLQESDVRDVEGAIFQALRKLYGPISEKAAALLYYFNENFSPNFPNFPGAAARKLMGEVAARHKEVDLDELGFSLEPLLTACPVSIRSEFEDEDNWGPRPDLFEQFSPLPEGAWYLDFNLETNKFVKVQREGDKTVEIPLGDQELSELSKPENQKNCFTTERFRKINTIQDLQDEVRKVNEQFAGLDKKIYWPQAKEALTPQQILLNIDEMREQFAADDPFIAENLQNLDAQIAQMRGAIIMAEHRQEFAIAESNLTGAQKTTLHTYWPRIHEEARKYGDFPWQATLAFAKSLSDACKWNGKEIEKELNRYGERWLQSFPEFYKEKLDTGDEWEDNPNLCEFYAPLPDGAWYLSFRNGAFSKVTKEGVEGLGNYAEMIALLQPNQQKKCMTYERMQNIVAIDEREELLREMQEKLGRKNAEDQFVYAQRGKIKFRGKKVPIKDVMREVEVMRAEVATEERFYQPQLRALDATIVALRQQIENLPKEWPLPKPPENRPAK